MPRSRPGHVRADTTGRPATQHAGPVIDGLSARALSEVAGLERTRNYLYPGDVGRAVALWKEFVHRPERELWRDYDRHWHDDDWLRLEWACCGSPLEARQLLDTVARAMSHDGARELRKIISRLDAFWTPPALLDVADGT
ncbi:hypothetical protein [Streptomyces varsoviensis]|uniref:Uncharacterized protein n=1 Tax=Streptomyces varsoviensis TaxID=67373 RepID=A0ABR5J7E3_9ACTN|nr:hypothetical protein [Streptomyces varsoviensis]KOG89259.1 hypothetical protein ADK38_15280 [Streptomyces varsoviensis]